MSQVTVFKGRTNVLLVNLGYDISSDAITSEIRETQSRSSALIATWSIDFATEANGTDGALRFVLDDSVTSEIEHEVGYMDIKRVSNGEPFQVNKDPIQVLFQEVITE